MSFEHIDGYLAETAYPSQFHQEFAPPWVDAVLAQAGFVPPRRERSAFRMLDLGCGDGLGLLVNAAAHPEGEFLGIDAMPAHIETANAAVRRLGLDNVRFRCETFAAALGAGYTDFDYISAQGVVSWVSPKNRAHVFEFGRRFLKPGGAFTIGYNAMPGWQQLIVYQQLVRAWAKRGDGSATQRFAQAHEALRALSAAGTRWLQPGVLEFIDRLRERMPADYFGHEYLNEHWTPLWSFDVHNMAAEHGLCFAGQTLFLRNRPDFCLKREQRAALEGIADAGLREAAVDLFSDTNFRKDVFVKTPAPVGDAREVRLGGWFAARAGADEADYSLATPGGRLRFDNLAARTVLAGLAERPAPLRTLLQAAPQLGRADLLNGVDALLAARLIQPADAPLPAPAARAAGAALRALNSGPDAVDGLVGRNGALKASTQDIALLFCDDAAVHARPVAAPVPSGEAGAPVTPEQAPEEPRARRDRLRAHYRRLGLETDYSAPG